MFDLTTVHDRRRNSGFLKQQALYCICTVLHSTVLYCIVLYCIVLYCIVLYCIDLYGMVWHSMYGLVWCGIYT